MIDEQCLDMKQTTIMHPQFLSILFIIYLIVYHYKKIVLY